MSKKEIIFSPAFDINKKGMLEPDQTVRYVPEWYKNLSRFEDSNSTKKLSQINDRGTDGSAMGTKMCTAFFDSFNMGYVYLLNDDLHVDIDIDGFPTLSWEGDEMLCDKRPIVDVAEIGRAHV